MRSPSFDATAPSSGKCVWPTTAPWLSRRCCTRTIRVAHAVRSLDAGVTPPRRQELADGFGYWAASYFALRKTLATTCAPSPPRFAMSRASDSQATTLQPRRGCGPKPVCGSTPGPRIRRISRPRVSRANASRRIGARRRVVARLGLSTAMHPRRNGPVP